ncbi:hypothetical protein D3C78_1058300 [compost metagenome]
MLYRIKIACGQTYRVEGSPLERFSQDRNIFAYLALYEFHLTSVCYDGCIGEQSCLLQLSARPLNHRFPLPLFSWQQLQEQLGANLIG